MDQNITERPHPLPYPEMPCAASWYAEHGNAPTPQQAATEQPTKGAQACAD